MNGNPSMEIPDKLLSLKTLTDGEKVTLVSLYRYAGRDDLCVWPSNRTISERTGHALRTTQKHLERLEELALIQRSNGAKREIILVYPTSHGAPPTPEETSPHVSRGTPPRLTGREPHYRNQPINQPINQESDSDNPADQPDLFPDDARVARKHTGPSLDSLWARHGALRNEAQSSLGKLETSLPLDGTRRKALKALLAAGHSESALIDAWSQARNDAIKNKSMRWFNGSTEIVPKNASRLSGQYEGESAESAKNSNGRVIGGIKGWGTAIIAGAGSISAAEQGRLKQDEQESDDLMARTQAWEMKRDHVIVERYGIKTIDELYARRRILTPSELEERQSWPEEQPPT